MGLLQPNDGWRISDALRAKIKPLLPRAGPSWCSRFTLVCRSRKLRGPALWRRLPRFVDQPDPSYDRHVTEQAQAVLATALRLTIEERAELAADLIRT
jgi:hypothetical protein